VTADSEGAGIGRICQPRGMRVVVHPHIIEARPEAVPEIRSDARVERPTCSGAFGDGGRHAARQAASERGARARERATTKR
jgi:hypothetical protein